MKTTKLSLSALNNALTSGDRTLEVVAIRSCKSHYFDRKILDQWKESQNIALRAAAILGQQRGTGSVRFLQENIDEIVDRYGVLEPDIGKIMTLHVYRPHTDFLSSLPEEYFAKYYSPKLIERSVGTTPPYPSSTIKELTQSTKWYKQCAGLLACANDYSADAIDLSDASMFIESERKITYSEELRDTVANAAVKAIRAKNLGSMVLQSLYDSYYDDEYARTYVLDIYRDRKGICLDPICHHRKNLRRFIGVPVTPTTLLKFAEAEDVDMNIMALYLCAKFENPPFFIINKGMLSAHPDIKEAGVVAAYYNSYPAYRESRMPEAVYKACADGAIVEAKIPKDAEVRGSIARGFRVNKAIITNVKGGFCGVPIGVSYFAPSIVYKEADHVVVDDFNPDMSLNGPGLYFFADEARARNYKYY